MKPTIKDGLQLLAAVLITGTMVLANVPNPQPTPSSSVETVSTTETVPTVKVEETPVETPKPVETAPTAVVEPTPVVAAPKVEAVPEPPAYTPTGGQADWLLASGIPQQYWRVVDYIVTRESGWDPCASYPSRHDCSITPVNACGLVMQNPCGKIGGDWRDPVAALKWADSYVTSRYGGWPGAYQHWLENNSY